MESYLKKVSGIRKTAIGERSGRRGPPESCANPLRPLCGGILSQIELINLGARQTPIKGIGAVKGYLIPILAKRMKNGNCLKIGKKQFYLKYGLRFTPPKVI